MSTAEVGDKILDTLLTEYGSIGLVIAGGMWVLIKYGSGFASWLKEIKSQDVEIRGYEVLLGRLQYWISFKATSLYIRDPGRKEVLKDLITLSYKTFQESLVKLAEVKIDKLPPCELFLVLMDHFNRWKSGSEVAWKEAGIPHVVISKYQQLNIQTIDYTIKSIELVCYSKGYTTNQLRMDAIYTQMTAMLDLMMIEGERTMGSLNGELTGLQYKGKECGPCTSSHEDDDRD